MEKVEEKSTSRKERAVAEQMYVHDAEDLSRSYLVSPILIPDKGPGILVFDLFPVIDKKEGEGAVLRMTGNWRVLKAVPDGDVSLLRHYPYAIQPYTTGPATFRMKEYGVTRLYYLVCVLQYPCLGPLYEEEPARVATEVLPYVADGPAKEAARKALDVLYPEGRVREVSWGSYKKPRGSSSYSSPEITEIENALAGLTLLTGSEAEKVLKAVVETAVDL